MQEEEDMNIVDGTITTPLGFLAQGVGAQIKSKDKLDLAIIYSQEKCQAAGVFTTNKVRAACIDLNRAHLENGIAQAIIVNSGNANACTGEQGVEDAIAMSELGAASLGIHPMDTLIASTGVIGVYMPMDKVNTGISKAAASLSREGGSRAAQAIMTTDLMQKEMAVELEVGGKKIRIGAIAKGSGMIHPNMATMLAFITTDAAISQFCLQKALRETVDQSFNMVSVDRDTSTNDMTLIMANGMAGNEEINSVDSQDYQLFKEALGFVSISLAKKIARDGEGANHLIEVQVQNAPDEQTARTIARSVTSSNLTKAAVFGEDANWGRILCAAGYSGAEFDPTTVDIFLGEEQMAQNGMGLVFDEEKAQAELQKETVTIRLDLHAGKAAATAWGCDLSYEYVRINAAYRT
jgi:glutamate N-acetyltransferase/amino-acid N-acetyltransferase